MCLFFSSLTTYHVERKWIKRSTTFTSKRSHSVFYIYLCVKYADQCSFFCVRYQLLCFSWNELSVWFVCFGLCSVTCFSLFGATPDLSCLRLPLESSPFLWLQDLVYFPIAPLIQSTFVFMIGWKWNNYLFTLRGFVSINYYC